MRREAVAPDFFTEQPEQAIAFECITTDETNSDVSLADQPVWTEVDMQNPSEVLRAAAKDPNMEIAVERTLSLLAPSVASVLRLRFGLLGEDAMEPQAIADQLGIEYETVHNRLSANSKFASRAMLEIREGTFDYAAWDNGYRKAPSMLALMAKAGMPIPEDASLTELAGNLKQTFKGIGGIGSLETDVVIKRFGLDGDGPMTLSELKDSTGLSEWVVRGIVKKAVNTLYNNLHNPPEQPMSEEDAASDRVVSGNPEVRQAFSGMTPDEVLRTAANNPGMDIAVERMLSLLPSSAARILRLHYGFQSEEESGLQALASKLETTPKSIATQLNRSKQLAAHITLEIQAGTFDYAAWEDSNSRVRGVLGFMAKAGLPIAKDATLRELAATMKNALETTETIDASDIEIIKKRYGLDGTEPVALATLGKRLKISYGTIQRTISRVISALRIESQEAVKSNTTNIGSDDQLVAMSEKLPTPHTDRAREILRQVPYADLVVHDAIPAPMAVPDDEEERQRHVKEDLTRLVIEMYRNDVQNRPRLMGELALCAQLDDDQSEVFYPVSEQDPVIELAKKICAACPLLEKCAVHVIEHPDPHAVVGMLTPEEVRLIRAERGISNRKPAPEDQGPAWQRAK